MARKNAAPRRRGAFLAAAALALAWLPLAATRLHDPDEYEHLHAALSVARGELPYRDFFEHHGPLTYLLLALPAKALGPTAWLLEVHRLASVGCLVATLFAAARLARRLAVPSAGGAAALGLASWCWFAEKGIEGRPDVPAMALAAWALVLLAERRSAFAAGLLFGLATLFTQKAAFLALGAGAGMLWQRRAAGMPWRGAAAGYVVGGALPWLLATAGFFWAGGGRAFLHRTIFTPLTWPAHAARADEGILHRVLDPLGWSPGHLAAAALGLACAGWRLRRRAWSARGGAVVTLATLGHLCGLALTPAAYLQYYLLMLPPLAALAAAALVSRLKRWPGGTVLAFAVACAALHGLRLARGAGFLGGAGAFLALGWADVLLASLAGLLAAAAFLMRGRARVLAAAAVLLALTVSSTRVGFQLAFWRRADLERRQLEAVRMLPPEDGTFLDGFSGLGCLRPHASYWWWINHHSAPLLEREGALPKLAELLANGQPAYLSLDVDLQEFLRRHPALAALAARRYAPLGGTVPIAKRQ